MAQSRAVQLSSASVESQREGAVIRSSLLADSSHSNSCKKEAQKNNDQSLDWDFQVRSSSKYWLIDWLIDWLIEALIWFNGNFTVKNCMEFLDWLIDWVGDWVRRIDWLIDWLSETDWYSTSIYVKKTNDRGTYRCCIRSHSRWRFPGADFGGLPSRIHNRSVVLREPAASLRRPSLRYGSY